MMFDRDHIYGLDIETDTSGGHGLDPTKAGITDIAIVSEAHDFVATGDELDLLGSTFDHLNRLQDGLLVTWNGTFFDLPFIEHRANMLGDREWSYYLYAYPQPGLEPKYCYLPFTPQGGRSFAFEGATLHAHLDISFAYRRIAEELGVKWSLKPVATALGIDVIEVDRERMHDLTDAERRAYVASDARATRELAIRLLGA